MTFLTLRINCRSFCVSFPLYRFQGSALSKELVYNITPNAFCQHYFSLFWEFFSLFCAVRIDRVIYLFIVRVFLYMLGIISHYTTICVRVFLSVRAEQVVYMGSFGLYGEYSGRFSCE